MMNEWNEPSENPELRIGREEAAAERAVDREYNESREKWAKKPLSPAMETALRLALKHGAVWAGYNTSTERSYVVSSSTLFGLERRGLLVLLPGSVGGLMGRPTDKALESRDR